VNYRDKNELRARRDGRGDGDVVVVAADSSLSARPRRPLAIHGDRCTHA